MGNFYADNEDLRWYIEKGLAWGPMVRVTEYDDRAPERAATLEEALSGYRDLLDAIGSFSAEQIAPLASAFDREEMKIVDGEIVIPPAMASVFEQMRDLGLFGLCVPRELGGLNAPLMLYMASIELIGRADVSVVAHYGFHGGIAMALLLYSVLEGSTTFDEAAGKIAACRFEQEIAEIVTGAAWGSMDITESDAGSDMGALRTTATCDANGQWTVTGTKIFITSGHGKHHVVIARTEPVKDPNDPMSGLKGLSLFLVPAFDGVEGSRVRTHSRLDAVEHKLGHNGSATIAISFEDAPAQLLGERGQGFQQMLLLMNNARVGVGFESLGLCEAARRLAVDYAAVRRSMGKTIDQHEMIADYLDEMATDCQAIRALAFHGAYHEEMNQKLRLKAKFFPPATDAERDALLKEQKRHAKKSRRVTPLLKYFASEKAVEMSRRALQIHGGYGYSKEYGAEKLLRDALVMPIYEGTSQIQALMAMKDALIDAIKKPQDFVRRSAAARWKSVSGNPNERRVARLQALQFGAQQHLMARIAGRKVGELRHLPFTSWSSALQDWDPKRDFGPAMLHAERLIQLMTDVQVAEILLDQAEQHPERVELLDRWLDRAEPRCRALHDAITTTGDGLLARLAAKRAANDDAAAK